MLARAPEDTTRITQKIFMDSIWRVAVGSLAVGIVAVPAIHLSAYIGIQYGQRRFVPNKESSGHTPLITISSHQKPVFTALSQAFVMKAFAKWVTTLFSDSNSTLDGSTRHALAACAKAVITQHSQNSSLAISERCGAHGVFAYNQLTTYHVSIKYRILS
jgi:acyl-CoA oxidase